MRKGYHAAIKPAKAATATPPISSLGAAFVVTCSGPAEVVEDPMPNVVAPFAAVAVMAPSGGAVMIPVIIVEAAPAAP